MTLSTQPYKGARDFYPEDYRYQKWMFGVCRKVLAGFGYECYDAPLLEPLDLYLAKTGDEIVNEQTYAFEDRGGRKVAIRPEMTPTVSRMVAARRQELSYPLRWYSIPNLWRYERPQKGRLREHWQLNVDCFGVEGIQADHEIVLIIDAIMKAFGAKHDMYTIKLNSRKFMDYVLHEYVGLNEVEAHSMSKLIDRMHKMDHAEFVAQADALCSPSQRDDGAVEKLLDVLAAKRFTQLPQSLQNHESLLKLKHLLELLEISGVTNAIFDATLMRGFDYYTDIVFEVFDTNPENNRSICGGGRYDGLVGLFGVEPVPTVGFGMGDVTLAEFLQGHDLVPQLYTDTDIYIALIGDIYADVQRVAVKFRSLGLHVAVDPGDRKLDKQIKTADKKAIHYLVVIGPEELKNEQFVLKNLKTGATEKHSIERIVSIVKDYRTNRP